MPGKFKYQASANIIVLIHVFWTLLLFGGAVFMFFARWYAPFQIGLMSFTLLIAIPFGRTCPLTLFEEWLRKKINPDYTNNRSYMVTYINKIFGTKFSRKQIIIYNGCFYVAAYIAAALIWTH
ncbi:MAG: DUF2784 family protein [Patescibacteria group bacterium]|nr:DUF2784 family protein [Patescibacteria group bacterium]